jgi:hypothetical protein
MEIFALSTREMHRGRLRKSGRNILLGNDDAITGAVAKLDKLTQVETGLVQAKTLALTKRTGRTMNNVASTVNTTHAAVQETRSAINQMSTQMTEVHEKLDNLLVSANEAQQSQLEIVRHILRPSQPDSAQTWYDRISKTRVPGTGDWVLKENIFKSWVEQGTPIIFVSGTPGAGKSYLTASMIAFLKDQFAPHNDTQVSTAYFFFKDNNPDTRSVHQALRDLAYQICITNATYQKHVKNVHITWLSAL